eukprot:NODE_218_length_12464_cov_0.653781.p4 type:complete len:376 gc:universal NODE_218_length_12464_cov_0.653781:6268-5141(-)
MVDVPGKGQLKIGDQNFVIYSGIWNNFCGEDRKFCCNSLIDYIDIKDKENESNKKAKHEIDLSMPNCSILSHVDWKELKKFIENDFSDISFFSVCDGHGKYYVVRYIEKFAISLLPVFLYKKEESIALEKHLTKFSEFLHTTLKDEILESEAMHNFQGGSTFTFALFTHKNEMIYVGTCGDSFIRVNNETIIAHSCDDLSDIASVMTSKNALFGNDVCYSYNYERVQYYRTRLGLGGYRMYGCVGDFLEDMDLFNMVCDYQNDQENVELKRHIFKFADLDHPNRNTEFIVKSLFQKNSFKLKKLSDEVFIRDSFIKKLHLSELDKLTLATDGFTESALNDFEKLACQGRLTCTSDKRDDRCIIFIKKVKIFNLEK